MSKVGYHIRPDNPERIQVCRSRKRCFLETYALQRPEKTKRK
jgi:hypothetical protein